MRLLSSVNQVVFLQVGQLSEGLTAGLTPEGTLSTVHSQMDLRRAFLRLVFTIYIDSFCQTQKNMMAGKF